MDREQAVKYLQSSGFSEEQIKAIEGAFTCDKCVYSTSEGCQYDDITEAIPPFEDCISRKEAISIAGIATLSVNQVVAALKKLPPVNPQEPKTDWIVPIILIDKKGEEHDGLMDKRRMLIYLHNIPAETAISLGYTWKSAEGSGEE